MYRLVSARWDLGWGKSVGSECSPLQELKEGWRNQGIGLKVSHVSIVLCILKIS